MTIFKKFALQGNFIFTSGKQAVFNSAGIYKTEDEAEIAQLSPIYTKIEEEEDMPKADPKEKLISAAATGALAAKTGMASSATLTAAAKTN